MEHEFSSDTHIQQLSTSATATVFSKQATDSGDGMSASWPVGPSKQASKFIRQKQYYDNINTKCKQYNGMLPEGNPSIELVAYNKI